MVMKRFHQGIWLLHNTDFVCITNLKDREKLNDVVNKQKERKGSPDNFVVWATQLINVFG